MYSVIIIKTVGILLRGYGQQMERPTIWSHVVNNFIANFFLLSFKQLEHCSCLVV